MSRPTQDYQPAIVEGFNKSIDLQEVRPLAPPEDFAVAFFAMHPSWRRSCARAAPRKSLQIAFNIFVQIANHRQFYGNLRFLVSFP
jgi:hypothetical protein